MLFSYRISFSVDLHARHFTKIIASFFFSFTNRHAFSIVLRIRQLTQVHSASAKFQKTNTAHCKLIIFRFVLYAKAHAIVSVFIIIHIAYGLRSVIFTNCHCLYLIIFHVNICYIYGMRMQKRK